MLNRATVDNIKKILIVNRGEIVGRIAKTAKKLGIKTVSIYSDVDEGSPHRFQTDDAVHLEGMTSSDTYLNFDKILHAIQLSGADAVHPGFGFVSENAKFVHFMKSNGVRFIGPDAKAMRAMGDKIESKILAKEAGVNVIPGLIEPIDDLDLAVKIADEIGYPVILKAAAGGGGKGIRIVWNEDELQSNFFLVQNEAQNSFNDGRIFIEKYINNPRHIEIQLLGDKFGNVVYLGERECTIQRRHQKVIEEAPSPFFENLGLRGAKIREEMGRQSVLLAKKIGYYSAGTVEFVVDDEGHFYFLEVNTRLQVEHPVTEEVIRIKNSDGTLYKLDLVEWMIRIENGEKIPFSQDDIYIDGASIEARIYAENPEANFMPSSGKIVNYHEPKMENLRVETGVEKGSEVTVYYDPMLAKICVYDNSRDLTIKRMKSVLSQLVIAGPNLKTNINFLEQFIRLQEFADGEFSTNFIKQKYGDSFSVVVKNKKDEIYEQFIVAALVFSLNNPKFLAISDYISSSIQGPKYINILTNIDKFTSNVRIAFEKTIDLIKIISINNKQINKLSRLISKNDNLLVLEFDNSIEYFKYYYDDMHFTLEHNGYSTKFRVYLNGYEEFFGGVLANSNNESSNDKLVLSPLPGRVIFINVKVGDKIDINTNLLTIEAMKMQNVIYSQKAASIKSIFVDQGSVVQADEKLIEFE